VDHEAIDDARRRVADVLRDLAEHAVDGDLDAEALGRLEAALAGVLPAEREGASPSWFALAVADDHTGGSGHHRHPFGLGASAVFPPLDLEVEGRALVGRTRLGRAWEGPPGLVHGGFLAAAFDMACSTLAGTLLGPSVTRSLRTRYLRPTFLGAELRIEVAAGPVDGRLLELTGRILADDQVTLKGTAQFAALAPDRFRDRRSGA
jgi:acyl-coenzyme A thioesterase PaaI-like protein